MSPFLTGSCSTSEHVKVPEMDCCCHWCIGPFDGSGKHAAFEQWGYDVDLQGGAGLVPAFPAAPLDVREAVNRKYCSGGLGWVSNPVLPTRRRPVTSASFRSPAAVRWSSAAC